MDNEKEQKKDARNIDKKVVSNYYKEYLTKSFNLIDSFYTKSKKLKIKLHQIYVMI